MSLNESNVRSQIKKYIAHNMLFSGDAFDYADDASLLDAGVIDSIGVMELVAFVSQTYGIEVPPADILPEHFDSISKLAGYIGRKQETCAA